MTFDGVQVRAGEAGDLTGIVALEGIVPEAPHWPEAVYAAMFDVSARPPRCVFVARSEAGLAGFAVGLFVDGGDGIAELESVVVAPDSRRAGLGKSLCSAVLEWCRARGAKAMVLEVRASSVGAVSLYGSLGFVVVGRRPGYYPGRAGGEEDAVVMRLGLEE